MLENIECAFCHSKDFQLIEEIPEDFELRSSLDPSIYRGPFHIVKCKKCSQALQNPRPDSKYIHHYYPKNYDCFSEWPPRNKVKKWLYDYKINRTARQIKKILPSGGCILDYGCGNGHLIISFKKRLPENYSFLGVDFSPAQVEKLRKDGIEAYEIHEGLNIQDIIPVKSIQIILINHVIEHVSDPYKLVKDFYEILDEDGLIIGETPNFNAWDARLFAKYWAGWHAPRHFYLFNFKTIQRLGEFAEFQVSKISSDLSGASHWALSLNYLLLGHVFKGYEKNRLPFYLLILLLFIPITILQCLFSQASIMRFQFKKKPKDYFSHYNQSFFEVEEKFFWYVGRSLIIQKKFNYIQKKIINLRYLIEIGCGAGGMLLILGKFFNKFIGYDEYAPAIDLARQRGLNVQLVKPGFVLPDTASSCDLICGFDVLEHIKDDNAALRECFRVLKSGGFVLLTVPARMNLWSPIDEFTHHYRRYEKESLSLQLKEIGFTEVSVSYFMFLLYPLFWMNRIFARIGWVKPENIFKVTPLLNKILTIVVTIEAWLFLKINFPVGSSLIVIARKPVG